MANLWPSVAIYGFIMLLMIALLFLTMWPQQMHGKADCSIENIELKDVRPYHCYGDFAPEFCPVPKTIHCNVEGDMPVSAYLISKLRGY